MSFKEEILNSHLLLLLLAMHCQCPTSRSSLFQSVMQRRLIVIYWRFRTTYRSHIRKSSSAVLDCLTSRCVMTMKSKSLSYTAAEAHNRMMSQFVSQHGAIFSVSPLLPLLVVRTGLFNPLTPNSYRGRTAPLTSKVTFYIFIQQMYVLNILNVVYTPRFFLFKMQFVS